MRKILVGLAALLVALLGALVPAPAAQASETADPVPPYCYRGDMDDGLVRYRFVTHQYGVNYYTWDDGRDSGNTDCLDNPQIVAGELSGPEKTCMVAGVAAVVGAFIPGIGTVSAVYGFATTCAIAVVVG